MHNGNKTVAAKERRQLFVSYALPWKTIEKCWCDKDKADS